MTSPSQAPSPVEGGPYVSYEAPDEDGLARITLVDGERGNPLHPASVAQLHDAVRAARRDRAGAVLLSAEGRFFSVGGDLAGMAAADDAADHIDDLADALHRTVEEITRLEAVVVAAVQGPAAGAGFPLAAAADVVLASERASFTLAYTRVGLSVDGGTSLLSATLGLHRLLRLALLNDSVDAAEAERLGLVARVCAPEELAGRAEELARGLARGPSRAYARTKRLLRDVAHPAVADALTRETEGIRAQAGSEEGREGIAAFLAKRSPRFE